MKRSSSRVRVGVAVAVMVAAIVWLALSGREANKSYYVTIPELAGMGEKAYQSHLRVEGFVTPGSIARAGRRVSFELNEFEVHTAQAASGRRLRVVYSGLEPPPDAFKENAQALAEGRYGRDGVFAATALQAKCSSKYQAAPPGPGTAKASAAEPGAGSRAGMAN